MIKKLINNELFRKILFTLMMVGIMELGREIVIPGLDPTTTRNALDTVPFLRNLANITGGQFNYPSLFSIGLGPYMTGMIIFQAVRLLDFDVINKLSSHQIGMIQRWISLVIAIGQSSQMVYLLRHQIEPMGVRVLGIEMSLIVPFMVLVAGAMLVAWMSDMTVKDGVGGSGVLIIPGIVTNIPQLLLKGQGLGSGPLTMTVGISIALAISLLIVLISAVYMNRAELRIPLQRPMVQNDFSQSYLPIRVLSSGSMPFMFSTTLFMMPSYLASLGMSRHFEDFVNEYITFDRPIGIIIYCVIVVLLGYAFSFMNFRPEITTKRLKKSGDYFFGVAPGEDTQRYLNRRLNHLTTIANVYFVILIGTPLVVGLYVEGITNFMFVFSNLVIMVTILMTVLEQIKVLHLRTQYHLLEL
jgi:preprotein translocase subunit SecY